MVFLLHTIKAAAPVLNMGIILVSQPITPYDRLVNAVFQVESKGDTLAYNIIEEAIGAFQIRPIRLKDFNQRTGNHLELTDCYNFQISKEIFLYYAVKIGFQDYESIARKWNGSGETTLDYWERVKSFL
jgi:hypothetical protein